MFDWPVRHVLGYVGGHFLEGFGSRSFDSADVDDKVAVSRIFPTIRECMFVNPNDVAHRVYVYPNAEASSIFLCRLSLRLNNPDPPCDSTANSAFAQSSESCCSCADVVFKAHLILRPP